MHQVHLDDAPSGPGKCSTTLKGGCQWSGLAAAAAASCRYLENPAFSCCTCCAGCKLGMTGQLLVCVAEISFEKVRCS